MEPTALGSEAILKSWEQYGMPEMITDADKQRLHRLISFFQPKVTYAIRKT
jgi:hypothetical protein